MRTSADNAKRETDGGDHDMLLSFARGEEKMPAAGDYRGAWQVAGSSSQESRDMYGFAVRPQHLKRYREHASIYKEEEAERCERWEQFLGLHNTSKPSSVEEDAAQCILVPPWEGGRGGSTAAAAAAAAEVGEQTDSSIRNSSSDHHTWVQLRTSHLWAVEQVVRNRRKSKVSSSSIAGGSSLGEAASADAIDGGVGESSIEAEDNGGGGAASHDNDDDSDEEFYDVERSDSVQDAADQASSDVQECPWEEELKVLVSGGVPMALRGELWQVFVGSKERWVHGYYQALLAQQAEVSAEANGIKDPTAVDDTNSTLDQQSSPHSNQSEKWRSQIEKDLPRTFPGHPALDEDGLNMLRCLLTAYARHNPAVGYCQAMNFLAALLLLLMPEENAFWTLTGIIDNYFGGYYTEKLVEAQVDQLVFEQLVRERFPRLSTHLDSLGVQVAWVSGPWFLSIFVNVLPWESVLRVWDVLLYEGNRSMLFRTGLALMETHAGKLMLQRDTGDAVAMLQSMGEATFDSSQLVLAACLGFSDVHEDRLEQLRNQHRPSVLSALHERSLELHLWHNTNGVAAKTGSLVDQMVGRSLPLRNSMISVQEKLELVSKAGMGGDLDILLERVDLNVEEAGSMDLQEQVVWLKTELCSALEARKAATCRAEELEVALMEMVKEDNRLLLSAQVEKLEAQMVTLKKALSDKEEQEQVMVQVLVRMEQEQRIADDARRFAELDAAAQRSIADEAKEMAEKATQALAAMEKRAVMAESMLEATINSDAGVGNAHVARHGLDPLTGNTSRGIARSYTAPAKPDLGMGWARRSTPGKVEGAGGIPSVVPDNSSAGAYRQTFFSRPFTLNWREKSKQLSIETKCDAVDNLQAGELLSPAPSSSPKGLEQVNGHEKLTANQTPTDDLEC